MDKIRMEVLKILGGVCVKCGYDDARALQIDHIDGGGTNEVKRIGTYAMYRKILENPEGYQLLCANCNWVKRAENYECLKPLKIKKDELVLDPKLFGIKT